MKINWLILSILFIGELYSQSVRLVRRDVDTTRSSFVTATYLFSFDIVIDDLDNCNNASFLLKFDKSKFVKFSGASINDFGVEKGSLLIDENNIPGQDETYLSIGIFSGQPLQENEFDSPNLLNLEFVVLPTADDDEIVTFSFENAFGAQYLDGKGNRLPLATAPVKYDIHGFVNVWPGDTDRDSDVDNIDWTIVYENLKFKERFPGYRSFKRQNASTDYFPQRALVWDVENATYSDCDGDGEVSVTDAAVVLINLDVNRIPVPKFKSNEELNSNYNKIPVYANFNDKFFGILGNIKINKDDIVSIENGDMLEGDVDEILDIKQNHTEFIIGDLSKNMINKESGVLFYIITEKEFVNYEINDLKVIDINNRLVDINTINSIENQSNLYISFDNDILKVNSETLLQEISIYDLSGHLINTQTNSNFAVFEILSPSIFLRIKDNNQYKTYPIIK